MGNPTYLPIIDLYSLRSWIDQHRALLTREPPFFNEDFIAGARATLDALEKAIAADKDV